MGSAAPRALAAAVAIVLGLTGCSNFGPGSSPHPEPTAQRVHADTHAALTLAPTATEAKHLDRWPGAAGRIVRCAITAAPVGGSSASPYRDGSAQGDPVAALDAAFDDFVDGDRDGLGLDRRTADRALYTVVAGSTIVEAVVVRYGPAASGADAAGKGWWVESWARCDWADLPPAAAAARGLQIWSDAAGRRVVSTRLVSSSGPLHCDLQHTTFLDLNGGMNRPAPGTTYLGHPMPDLRGDLARPAVDRTALPPDAVDSGYHLGRAHLWFSPDRTAAYVGSSSADVALWPKVAHPFGCA